MIRPRITLVINPASNKGTAATVGATVAEHLRRAADVRELIGANAAESVALLAHAANDADAVVVCGGDGIVHLAVNALAEGQVPLGIIPAGTGNDTATALGVDPDPVRAADELLAAVQSNRVRRVDLGYCAAAPVSPDATGRWWVSMLYAGFDSAVNERANRMRWPTGKRRYDVAIAAELIRLSPRALRLRLDGEAVETAGMTLVAIGNGPMYGGGKQMTPRARMDDGIFDVTVVGPVSRLTLARLAPTLPHAGHLRHPAVTTYRATEISIEAPDTTAWADGEPVGELPLTTRCVPAALPVLVPTGAPAPGLSA